MSGGNRMLRLQYQGGSEELPRLHYQKYAQSANTLHSMGEELSIHV